MADSYAPESFAGFIRRKGGTEAEARAAALLVNALMEGEIAIPCGSASPPGGTFVGCVENSSMYTDRTPASFSPSRLGVILDPKRKETVDENLLVLYPSTVIGTAGEKKPLIIENGLLYLYRYWQYEVTLAERLKSLAADRPDFDLELLKSGIAAGFADAAPGDRQRLAAIMAVASRLCIISGGPGTGKSTTVRRIIRLLQQQAKGERFRVLLAAPTGKAAGRLKQLLLEGGEGELSASVATIHRLLGYIPGSVRFRHDSANRLACELLIVDEASMIPLPLMAKLLAALPDNARLILLGDRDQLSSVEPGAVLGDICNPEMLDCFTCEISSLIDSVSTDGSWYSKTENRLADSIVRLDRSYRFTDSGGIGLLSRLVNSGDAEAACQLLCHGEDEVSRLPEMATAAGEAAFRELVLAGFLPYLRESDPLAALKALDSFRLLCAVRNGEQGVVALNRKIESILEAYGAINPENRWYAGRPVMVTANDYTLKLYNGDIGIVMADPARGGEFTVFFLCESGGVRAVSPARLPAHETCFAMTVHKSQGSEFDRVLLMLPEEESRALTRELVYTGITRAKRSLVISAGEEILKTAITRPTVRNSGLGWRLWGGRENGGELTGAEFFSATG